MKRLWYPILAIAFTYAAMLMGGGFSTGREIVEFHARFGTGGIYSLIIAAVSLSYLGLISLSLAVRWQAFDYKSFLSILYSTFLPDRIVPKATFIYDISIALMTPISIAVMISAFASMLVQETGMLYGFATAIGAIIIIILATFGSRVVRGFGFWGSLCIVACLILALSFILDPGKSFGTIAQGIFPLGAGWMWSGFLFMAYNAICILAAISIAEVLKDRFSAVAAGCIGGMTAALCYAFVYIVLMMYYPSIIDEPLPLWFTFDAAGIPALRFLYDIILSLAVLTTGVGSVTIVVKRFMPVMTEKLAGKEIPARLILSSIPVLVGLGLSSFGIITLISVGYTVIAGSAIVLFVVPVLIFGSWHFWRKDRN